jgi:hypothetical protein
MLDGVRTDARHQAIRSTPFVRKTAETDMEGKRQ